MVAFSALVGYLVIADHPLWSVTFALAGGIALLSGAASMLNQIQERNVDAGMQRTRFRPLVTGEIKVGDASLLATSFIVTGFMLLTAISLPTALAGLLALFFYNGLYTPLKRHSSLALFPGALSGALPVAAGWLAGSGSMQSPGFYSLLIFMFLWQVPHFICMAIRERDDYRQAGLSLVPDSVTAGQLLQLLRLWSAALAIGALLLVALGFVPHPFCAFVAIGTLFWLVFFTFIPFKIAPEVFAAGQGRRLKLFLGLFLLLILVDSVLI
jgi:protoheme IX farnesyltransferase